MKLALISTTYHPDPGGLQVAFSTLANTIDTHFQELHSNYACDKVVMILPERFEELSSQHLQFRHISVRFFRQTLGPFGLLLNQIRVSKILKSENITHAHGQNVAADGVMLKSNARLKKILTTHGGDLAFDEVFDFGYRIRFWGRFLVKRGIRGTDALVAVSPSQKAFTEGLLAQDKIWIIGNPIDTPTVALKSGLAIPNQYSLAGPMFISMGGGRPIKGLNTLIQAFALYKREGHPGTLVIASGGPYIEYMTEFASTLEVGQHIHFTGNLDTHEKYSWMNRSDVFVSSSRYESFGLAAMEAAQLGLPLMLSNVGGFADNFENGRSALMFDPSNVVGIKEGFLRMKDKKMRNSLAIESKNVASRFQPRKVMVELFELYEKL